jgi:hypothetical protein
MVMSAEAFLLKVFFVFCGDMRNQTVGERVRARLRVGLSLFVGWAPQIRVSSHKQTTQRYLEDGHGMSVSNRKRRFSRPPHSPLSPGSRHGLHHDGSEQLRKSKWSCAIETTWFALNVGGGRNDEHLREPEVTSREHHQGTA